jgi:cell division protein FtsN
MPTHFEITMTRRQMAGLLAAVVLLVLVAFGAGIVVGGGRAAPASDEAGLVAVAPEPTMPEEQPTTPASAASLVAPTTSSVATPPAAAATNGGAGVAAAVLPAAAPGVKPTARPTLAPAETSRPRAATPERRAVLAKGAWVQVGALAEASSAEKVQRMVVELGYTPAQVVVQRGGDGKYRVRVGPFPDVESARRVEARIRAHGFAGAFVVRS